MRSALTGRVLISLLHPPQRRHCAGTEKVTKVQGGAGALSLHSSEVESGILPGTQALLSASSFPGDMHLRVRELLGHQLSWKAYRLLESTGLASTLEDPFQGLGDCPALEFWLGSGSGSGSGREACHLTFCFSNSYVG